MFSGNDAADHPQHGLNRQRPRVAARPSRVMREANADGSPMWRRGRHVLLGWGRQRARNPLYQPGTKAPPGPQCLWRRNSLTA